MDAGVHAHPFSLQKNVKVLIIGLRYVLLALSTITTATAKSCLSAQQTVISCSNTATTHCCLDTEADDHSFDSFE
jgi:hypothetical protein